MLVTKALRGAGLRGTADVQNLQTALAGLAMATNRPAINPGPISGDVTDQTMLAIANGLDLLTEQLPATVYLALQAAMILGATSSTAKSFVGAHAAELTAAVGAATLKYRGGTSTLPLTTTSTSTSFFDQFFAPGWYMTPVGLGLIGILGYAAYRTFFATPRAA